MQSARIIDIIDDHEQDQHNGSLQDVMKRVTPSLRIPTAFTNDQWAVQPSGRAMIAWRNSASSHLEALYSVVEKEDASAFSDPDLFSNIIALAVPFTGSGPWTKEESRTASQGSLGCKYDTCSYPSIQSSFASFPSLLDKFSAQFFYPTSNLFSIKVYLTL
jgi:hypothetical protein